MKIVTGYTGTPHISSNDDQARNQGIFGRGGCVLDVGNKLNATLTNATTVTLEDGDGVIQGVHFRIEPGMTEAVSISPGTSGYNRIDLICARYTKDASTGVEDVSLAVIEGTPTTSTASAPAYTEGDILAGDTLAEFPLWKVAITGLTPELVKIVEQAVPASKNTWKREQSSGLFALSDTFFEVVYEKTFSEDTEVIGSFITQSGTGTLVGALITRGEYAESNSRKIANQYIGYQTTQGSGAPNYIALSFSTIVPAGEKLFLMARKSGANSGNIAYDYELNCRPALVE